MSYCLDTSVIIDILRGDENLLFRIKPLQNRNNFCITPITLAELYKGAFLAKKQKDAIRLVDEFCDSVELLDFTKEACEIFGRKYLELKKGGKQTQEADLMIASIAIANDLTFITRNSKHFANIRELKFEEW